MSLRLTIRHDLYRQIIEYAQLGAPYEICGFIGGHNGQAETVVPVPNASQSPRDHFEFERQAMVSTIITLQRSGQDIIAIYHSHPESAAVPSVRDIQQATWPDAMYVIVGLPEQSDVRAWSLRDGRATPVEINVID